MIDFLRLLACALTTVFRSRARLEAEILVLRHQLNILQRKSAERAVFKGYRSPKSTLRATRRTCAMPLRPPVHVTELRSFECLGRRTPLVFGQHLSEQRIPQPSLLAFSTADLCISN